MFCMMQPHQVANCVLVLREFSKWRPGPAGRGGDRASGKLGESRKLKPEDDMRCVKQKTEDVLDKDVCEEDEDDISDAFSMRSTVVNVKRVQEFDVSSNKKTSCEGSGAISQFPGLLTSATSVQEILNQSSINAAAEHLTNHKLSSADILNSLFLQVAASRVSQTNISSGNARPQNGVFPSTLGIPNSFVNDTQALGKHGFSMSPPMGLNQLWNHQVESLQSSKLDTECHRILSDLGRSQGPILPPLKQVLLESAIKST